MFNKIVLVIVLNSIVVLIWYVLGAFYWMSWDITKWSYELLRIIWSLILAIGVFAVNMNLNCIKRWLEDK